MNKHIERIAGQVLDEVVPETWVALGYDKVKEIQRRTAELIVRECLTLVEPGLDSGDEWCVTLKETAQMIKEHFGVEE